MRQKALLFFFLFVCPIIFPSDSWASRPFIDLRHPVYLITERSFFLGCDKEPALICANDPVCALADCRKRRIRAVLDGIDDWFKHFAKPTRPRAFVVASRNNVPWDAENPPIYLRIAPGICNDGSGGRSAACYSAKYKQDPAAIYFEDPSEVYALIVAHEFGHALGYNHRDVPKNAKGYKESIMMPTPSAEVVLPWDLEVLCNIHPECPPLKNNW